MVARHQPDVLDLRARLERARAALELQVLHQRCRIARIQRIAVGVLDGVVVLFVQNLAVLFEFPFQINDLETQRFRDRCPFRAKSGGFPVSGRHGAALQVPYSLRSK